ncbi:MAG TPA: M20/M25/M40 family metallo-hydrolase [Lacunisphaera sp.]|nr:M20/M25/M40 family metallo-hydrolase [Lacunisphaera sp.]
MPPPSRPALSLLRELVACPSVHPEGDAGGAVAGEASAAGWLAPYLRGLGADVTMPLLAAGRPMVVAVFEPLGKPTATVVLAPHLDTVGVAGMTVPPFQLTRRNGRLYGRGACDTKGPMAALLWAFGQWIRRSARNRGRVRWVLAATAGEEQGSLGAQALVRAGFSADFAVALEPTDLRVVSAAKGVLRVWVETKGKAAHGSRPERGINAIQLLLPFAQAVEIELAPTLAARVHPVLGRATVNLGVIQGGGELNIVPEQCRLGLDLRTHPGCTEAGVLKLLGDLRRRHAPEARLILQRRAPAFVTDRRNPWAASLRRHARGWDHADWFCDANVFAAHGIPAVAFGPGNIAQAHTKDEYITEEALAAGGRAFLGFLTGSA